MKKIFNIFLLGALLAGFAACNDKDQSVFEVLGEKSFSVEKEGELISVILRTTQDYTVTPEGNWCNILAKQAIGFKINVNENVTIKERENRITVESPGYDPVVITISQDPGDLFFRIAESEKTRMFPQAGETQTVVIQTNLDSYDVEPDAGWCTVSNKTQSGFNLTAEKNEGSRRTCSVTIKAEGMSDIPIKVTQNGEPFLRNPYFLDGNFDPWVIERTSETIFVAGTWIPASITDADKSRYRAIKIDAGSGEGSIFQTVNNIPDGTYTLRFICQAGGNTPNGDDLWLSIIDSNGVETKESIYTESRGGWMTITRTLEITGGKCTIGLRAYRSTSSSPLWFHALGFVLE